MSFKHILVAVDLSESSQKVIDKAISLAKESKCKVSFVFVDVDTVERYSKQEHVLQQQLQSLADESDYPITETLVVTGDLQMKLAGLVREKDVDLVICGHHHRFLSGIFSATPKVANAVEADMFVVYLDK